MVVSIRDDDGGRRAFRWRRWLALAVVAVVVALAAREALIVAAISDISRPRADRWLIDTMRSAMDGSIEEVAAVHHGFSWDGHGRSIEHDYLSARCRRQRLELHVASAAIPEGAVRARYDRGATFQLGESQEHGILFLEPAAKRLAEIAGHDTLVVELLPPFAAIFPLQGVDTVLRVMRGACAQDF